jgi:hypothetical protein
VVTLSPLGIFFLYIALAVVPSDAETLTLHFSEYDRFILVKEDGSWMWINDVGMKSYVRKEQTRVTFYGAAGEPETFDLKPHFDFTGGENWKEIREVWSSDKKLHLFLEIAESQLTIRVQDQKSSRLWAEWKIPGKD